MSKTWTQFECESCAERRASSRNIEMNFFFSDRCGRTRLMATCLRNPCSPRSRRGTPPPCRPIRASRRRGSVAGCRTWGLGAATGDRRPVRCHPARREGQAACRRAAPHVAASGAHLSRLQAYAIARGAPAAARTGPAPREAPWNTTSRTRRSSSRRRSRKLGLDPATTRGAVEPTARQPGRSSVAAPPCSSP